VYPCFRALESSRGKSPSNFGWLEQEPKTFRWRWWRRSRSLKFVFRFHSPGLQRKWVNLLLYSTEGSRKVPYRLCQRPPLHLYSDSKEINSHSPLPSSTSTIIVQKKDCKLASARVYSTYCMSRQDALYSDEMLEVYEEAKIQFF